ncbi:MAG TPA: phenylalanine--tRNA ligase subunit beta [Alphaproteobacteria bacterium]|nr:phenylalanine--tRNA ligase subunit beta [Alphaproteobacteria bacterium]
MKFTLGWLKDHLETTASLDQIVEKLTALGLEVESVDDPGRKLRAFTVARVIKAEPHPNADRLRVCQVETAQGTVQVVCGAPNARTGMKAVYAAVGSHVPGIDLDLKAAKIRGVDSNGMLVSEREMGLSDEHEGIIEMPADAPVGAPFAQLLGLDDPVIDVALTPNRPDCTGVRGIARDLAAAGLGTLKPMARTEKIAPELDSPIRWVIDADPANACPHVAGRYFRGVKNGPSPKWLQERLKAVGLRPISALVDITNYVSVDLGRPLHVFDAAKLAGGTLHMRVAKDGEPFMALTEKAYTLSAGMTVIADPKGVHGVGGIMGGLSSSCTEATTEVFLEVALFDPIKVAETGRRLQINSDARYRFERGVDPRSAEWGVDVASRFIKELCGGQASDVVRAGAMPDWKRPIAFRPERVRALGGVDVPDAQQRAILKSLGFEFAGDGATLTVTPASWRPDMHGEADVIEEIVRVHGIDQVAPVSLPRTTPLPAPAVTRAQRRVFQVRRALAAHGLNEAVTYSFMAGELADLFGGVAAPLRLANPISADLDVMRPSILPNLLAAAGRNIARGLPDPGLFEVGPVYRDDTPKGQALVAAGLRQGRVAPPHWAEKARPVDVFDAKALALAGLDAAGAPTANLQAGAGAPGWYHPGRSGLLRLGNAVLGQFGELHPAALARFDVKGPAIGFELFLDAVPLPKQKGTNKPPLKLSAFQPVVRDFAFVLDETVAADQVVRAAQSVDRALITEVTVFDLFTGAAIGAGKKSLAISVTLQPTERTLTEAEIDAVGQKIVANVAKHTGAVLRS